jgi:TRAP-type transport system periplasmic protein
MQYDELSPQAAAELRKATAGIVDEVRKRATAEVVDRVVAEARK